MRKKFKIILVAALGCFSSAGVALLWWHGVSNEITDTDRLYIEKFTSGIVSAANNGEFGEQVRFIQSVQDSVLSIAPINKGLPYGQEREPKDLFDAKEGLCFDRSRVIEKILRHHGFETRHIFIYSTKGTNTVSAFLTPGVPSHAVSEVLTAKGWLVVDSNDRWISLSAEGGPVSMADIAAQTPDWKTLTWAMKPPPIYTDIAPFTFVYGLYSRHGEFYPPYNFIPDVNYVELSDNFF